MKLVVQGHEAYAYTGGKSFDPALPCGEQEVADPDGLRVRSEPWNPAALDDLLRDRHAASSLPSRPEWRRAR